MIDKQKLLQWIEQRKEVYEPHEEDTQEYRHMYKGMLKMLNQLNREIDLGNLDTEEEPGPRFNMDENGNLTLIEDGE